MNAIAFSLYGSHPRYLHGAIENARDAKLFYPDWQVHVWVSDEVNHGVKDTLLSHGAVVHAVQPLFNKMFCRLLIHDLPEVERYIIRDVDSRFSKREARAVNGWIASGKQLHVMRDHPYHMQSIMGGMWGWRKQPGDINMLKSVEPWSRVIRYGQDQDFLRETIWNGLRPSVHVHDSCGIFDRTRNWPPDGESFVGEYIDEHNRPNKTHRIIRSDYLSSLV